MKLNQMCLPIRTGMAAILFFILIFGLINPILCDDEFLPTSATNTGDTGGAIPLSDIKDSSGGGGGLGGMINTFTEKPNEQTNTASPTSEGTSEGRDPFAWENLGIEYWNKGYSAMDALDAFETAIKQDPKDDTAMLYGGLVWFYDAESTGIEGDYNNALELFNNAIKVDQNYAEAWYYRGSACQKLGDYYMSIGSYDIATQYYNNATEAFDTSTGLTWRIGGLDGLPIKMR